MAQAQDRAKALEAALGQIDRQFAALLANLLHLQHGKVQAADDDQCADDLGDVGERGQLAGNA